MGCTGSRETHSYADCKSALMQTPETGSSSRGSWAREPSAESTKSSTKPTTTTTPSKSWTRPGSSPTTACTTSWRRRSSFPPSATASSSTWWPPSKIARTSTCSWTTWSAGTCATTSRGNTSSGRSQSVPVRVCRVPGEVHSGGAQVPPRPADPPPRSEAQKRGGGPEGLLQDHRLGTGQHLEAEELFRDQWHARLHGSRDPPGPEPLLHCRLLQSGHLGLRARHRQEAFQRQY